jgi:hypothetical protein
MAAGKWAMFCGVLGALWMLAMVIVGGATYPGYSHVAQYISELGANGAPQGAAVSWLGFLPVGILISAFALFAWLAAPRNVLSGIGFVGVLLFAVGYIAAAFFRCDYGCRPEEPSASQMMHNMFGLLGYVFAPVCLLLLGLAARKWEKAGLVSTWAFVSAVVALIGLFTMAPTSPVLGLSQRAIETAMLSWVVVCGLYLGRQPRTVSVGAVAG